MLAKLYEKYKVIIMYLIFGVLTTIVSIISYVAFLKVFDDNALLANVFSWIIAVSFAYITNRIWVFDSKNHGFKKVLKEIFSFYAGRFLTLVLEEIILFVGISLLGMDKVFVKLLGQILIVISNYILSKFLIF